MCSKARLTIDKMMQMEKIHFEISKLINCVGAISEDHSLKTSKLIAVNVSTPYTAHDRISEK
jgi:hypothetical protein